MMTVFVMNKFVKEKLKFEGYVKARFVCGDDLGRVRPYQGWHNPKWRWNGWAMPMFGKEEFRRLIGDLRTNDLEHMKDVVAQDWHDTEIENLHGFMSEIIDALREPNQYGMYSFRNADWCWEDVKS